MSQPPSEWTVLTLLEWGTDYFEEKGIKNPRLSIEWLLSYILEVKRLDLYLKFDRPLSQDELELLRPLIKRRASHEPLQYITGETDFFNATIRVKPGVLIPRVETEQLVELILNATHVSSPLKVLDIGTGSGCIPIALKKACPNWEIYATDISDLALEIATENASLNQVELNLVRDDIFSPSAFPPDFLFDIIISNPPYILNHEKSTLDDEVVKFEPELALFCDSTEKIYGAIHDFSHSHLVENGRLFLELNEATGNEVLTLFDPKKWHATLLDDYDKKTRFLSAKKLK